jgi:NADH:ubiquinone oxidoreductase subunit E
MASGKNGSSSGETGRAGLLPALKQELVKGGRLSEVVMSGVADKAGVPLQEAYGVATFYSRLPLAAGKNIIRVCKCVPCGLKDAPVVIAGISREIGVGPGQTTPDGKFTFELVNCIGACDHAPAMMVNDTLYGDLTPEKITGILRSY